MNEYLRYTNLLLLISIGYLCDLKKIPKLECILACLLIVTVVFSQLFWSDPVQNSTLHQMDAIVAKIVIFSFILYTLVYKFRVSYLFVLFAVGITFYLSNKYSSQEWCCDKHIACHGLLHFFCFTATFFAFVPV